MGWAFVAWAHKAIATARRVGLVVVALVVAALAVAAAIKLRATDDPCAPAFLDEVQEIRLIDHPECRDGGAP